MLKANMIMSITLVRREHIHLRGGIDSINTIKPTSVSVPKNVADSIKLPAKNEMMMMPMNIKAPLNELLMLVKI